jgi:protein-S-isoprenylcysteine O-methyltransferase Ste14
LFRHRGIRSLLLLPVLLWYGEVERAVLVWPAGIFLLLLGGGLRLWSIGFIGRSARTRGDKAKRLITSGPFAMCRNPIYLANMVASCGFVVLCQVIWYVPVYLVLSFAFYSLVVRYEEYLLRLKYPEQYQSYTATTPRWIPRPAAGAFAKPPHGLREVLYREKSFFQVAALGLLLALIKQGVEDLVA